MNLQVLRRSRTRPLAGDIFAWRLRGHDFGFGRVIRTDVELDGPPPETLLLYFYSALSKSTSTIPPLDRERLALAPILTNRLGWTSGYFVTIEHRPLVRADVLQPNCFDDKLTDRFVDEDGRVLPEAVHPCGIYALSSYRTIDVRLSLRFGLKPTPDTLPPPPSEPRSKRASAKGNKRARGEKR